MESAPIERGDDTAVIDKTATQAPPAAHVAAVALPAPNPAIVGLPTFIAGASQIETMLTAEEPGLVRLLQRGGRFALLMRPDPEIARGLHRSLGHHRRDERPC